MTTNDGRFLDDAESLCALRARLGPKLLAEYESFKALNLESGFPNRKMILYTLKGGQPSDICILTLGYIEMTSSAGPAVEISDAGGNIVVGVVPQKWRDRDLFIHVPQNFIFKWKAKQSRTNGLQFMPHYALLYKTRSKEHLKIEGDTQCATLNQFRDSFPDVSIRY